TELLDEGAVAVDVLGLQVLEQPTTTADEQQEAATAVVVVLVRLQVLGELENARGEQSDLDLGGTRVALDRGVLGHDLLLCFGVERHRCSSSVAARRAGAGPPGLSGDPRPFYGSPQGIS